MSPPRIYRLLPLFLLTYVALALFPIVTGTGSEVFPFFSFKLYSKVPQGYAATDVAGITPSGDTSLLLFRNPAISFLERKAFAAALHRVRTSGDAELRPSEALAFRQNLPPATGALYLVDYDEPLRELYLARDRPHVRVLQQLAP